jgi:hypothetical protein
MLRRWEVSSESISGMHETISIIWHLFVKVLGDVWEFVGDYRLYFGPAIIGGLIGFFRSKESGMKRIWYCFVDAVLATVIFFVIVLSWKSVVVFREFWNPSVVLSVPPPPTEPPLESEHSQTDAELSKKLADLEAQINANRLSGFTDQRLDEMTNQMMNSLIEYVHGWSEARFLIRIGTRDELLHGVPNGAPNHHTLSREEEQAIKQKETKYLARRDAGMRKGLKDELKPISTLLDEIYNNRLYLNQRKNAQPEYQEVEGTLKNLKSGNYDLTDVRRLIEGIRQFEILLKATIHP